MGVHYINGKIVDDSEAKISIADLGFSRGYGVFDVLRTYQKKPFHLFDSWQRLHFSARMLNLPFLMEFEKMQTIVDTLLQQFEEDEATIKLIVTGNQTKERLVPDREAYFIASVFSAITFDQKYYLNGATATTTSYDRPFPQSKNLFYTPAILALQSTSQRNALEAIYLNSRREVLEGATSNFFCIKDGTLITSNDEHVLHGITRQVVLKLGADHFPIEMRPISYCELSEVDEVFLTSCNKQVLPIVQIDDITIGNGQVGPGSKMLLEQFLSYACEGEYEPLMTPRYAEPAGSIISS